MVGDIDGWGRGRDSKLQKVVQNSKKPLTLSPSHRRRPVSSLLKMLDSGLRRITSDLPACGLSRMASCSINDKARVIRGSLGEEFKDEKVLCSDIAGVACCLPERTQAGKRCALREAGDSDGRA